MFPGAGTQTLYDPVPPPSVHSHLYLMPQSSCPSPAITPDFQAVGEWKEGRNSLIYLLSFRTIPTSSHIVCLTPSCKGHLETQALIQAAMYTVKN